MFEDKKYDDSDLEVWEKVYSKAYRGKVISEKFKIDCPEESRGKRIVAKSLDGLWEIGGETDFNFSTKIGMHRRSKYSVFKKILETIEDENEKKEALKQLKYCKNHTYEFENFSLLLCNGSMQTLKGTLDKDRLDVFVYLLDNYYRGKDEIILSHCSSAYDVELRDYLNLFKDKNYSKESVYKYCEEIYHIKSRKLVKDLIASGKKSINSPERVVEYMRLAVRFWNSKSAYYYDVKIREHKNIKLVKNINSA